MYRDLNMYIVATTVIDLTELSGFVQGNSWRKR